MAMAPDDQEYRIRMALAGRAHDADIVRLAHRDLTGMSHLVASRQGLFAVNPGDIRLIAHGQFYGLTIDDDTIFAFEACDRPRIRSCRGRVLWFRHDAGHIKDAGVVVRALDNGCHQLDLIGEHLYLTDTYNQRVLRLSRDGEAADALYPLPAPDDATDAGYRHVNSILAHGDKIYLLLHNDSRRTGRDSEVAVFDRSWRRTGTIPLAGQGCHSLAVLEDGTLLTCGSARGELVGASGMAIKVSDRMTRGLSLDESMIVVGDSVISEREARDRAPGAVYFLDRTYRRFAALTIPGPVMEIRRIDGRDRSLSKHLERVTPRDQPPVG